MKIAKLNDKPEIFFTLQGEGKNVGVPSVFVRLTHCNLYCVWCDTDYTWNFQGTTHKHRNDLLPMYQKYRKQDLILEMQASEVADQIKQHDCRNVVITGGEPMLQQSALVEMMKLLPQHYFEVETNATMHISPEFDQLVHQYNCSPKLANSSVVKEHRRTKFFSDYAHNMKSVFKFVVSTDEDLIEVEEIVEDYEIPRGNIWLMSEGRTQDEQNDKSQWLAEIVKRRGWRFCSRLHIALWGSRRGI